MTTTLWIAVLSSSLLTSIFGGFIGGWFNLRAKQNDYQNEYFKSILARRIAAYEEIEHLIAELKTAVLDNDNRPYHFIFTNNDESHVYKILLSVTSKPLWISDQIFDDIRKLNLMIVQRSKTISLIEFGKVNYKTIAELRTNMEKILLADMLKLHDVPSFLKNKKPTDSYTSI